jgi:hypothetical protein
MITYIPLLIFSSAATLGGHKVHVVIIVLGISPKRIVRVVQNGLRGLIGAKRTSWDLWRGTHRD